MKLKYYLKGFGIGVVFATLVLSISFYVRKNENKNISRQEVESLAVSYGMVYPEKNTEEELEQNGLDETVLMRETQADSGREKEVDKETETEIDTETETIQEAETTLISESDRETETVGEAETVSVVEPESATEAETTTVLEESSAELKTITIVFGMEASAIAKLFEEAGIIENAEDFNRYLIEAGYTKRIRTGVYTFAVGTDYETITEELTRVPKWH